MTAANSSGTVVHASERPLKPLGFWVTLCLAVAAALVANLSVAIGLGIWRTIDPNKVAAYQAAGALTLLHTGMAVVPQTVLLFLAARLASNSIDNIEKLAKALQIEALELLRRR